MVCFCERKAQAQTTSFPLHFAPETETKMAKHSFSSSKGSDGKTYETRSTYYNNGAEKHVTREQGTVLSEGRLVRVTRKDP